MQTQEKHHVVIDPEVHGRLLANKERICSKAGIPVSTLYTSAREVCTVEDLEWMRNINKYSSDPHTAGGYCMMGGQENVVVRMQHMAAALIRNFNNARVINLHRLLTEPNVDEECKILFIPNLHPKTHGKNLSSWQMGLIFDLLTARLCKGDSTVLFIEDEVKLRGNYPSLLDFINTNYHVVTGGLE